MSAKFINPPLFLMLLIGLGCQPSAPPQPHEPLPKLTQLEPTTSQPGHLSRLVVRKLVFAADDGRVDLALEMLQPPPLDPALLSRWRANALRIAQLPSDQWPILAANLPQPINSQTSVILLSARPTPVTLVPAAPTVRTILEHDARGNQQSHRLAGGEYQLLVKTNSTDAATLDILPYYFQPNTTTLPRTPQELMTDGISFTSLNISAAPLPDGAWLIWSDTTLAAQTPADPTLPIPLGHAMLTGRTESKPVRLLLILTTATPSPPAP